MEFDGIELAERPHLPPGPPGHRPHLPAHRGLPRPDRARAPAGGRAGHGGATGGCGRTCATSAAPGPRRTTTSTRCWSWWGCRTWPTPRWRPSGSGMCRLVELARALVGEPRLLMADEPSSGLDVHETRELAGVLRTLQTERGMAVLLVEHDLGMVGDVVDRCIVMDLGPGHRPGHLRRGHGRPRACATPTWGSPRDHPGRRRPPAPDRGRRAAGPRGRPRERRLRPLPGPVRRELQRPGGRRRRPAGLQRGGQVDRGPGGLGAPSGDLGVGAHRRPRRDRPARLPDRPGRPGPRPRGPGDLRQPDGGGEPGPRLPPAGRTAGGGRTPWPTPTRRSRSWASGASSAAAPCRAASSGCSRWPRCWWSRPAC